jgi:hypothetical protein
MLAVSMQTELMAAERGFTVDTEGFKALMENDRLISKADTQVLLATSSSCYYRYVCMYVYIICR